MYYAWGLNRNQKNQIKAATSFHMMFWRQCNDSGCNGQRDQEGRRLMHNHGVCWIVEHSLLEVPQHAELLLLAHSCALWCSLHCGFTCATLWWTEWVQCVAMQLHTTRHWIRYSGECTLSGLVMQQPSVVSTYSRSLISWDPSEQPSLNIIATNWSKKL